MTKQLLDDIGFLGSIFAEMESDFEDQDYEPILTDFADDLSEAHQGYFDSETDPTGSPWVPLAASTVARKGHDTILVETGNLQESLRTGHPDNIFEIDTPGGGDWNLAWGTMDEKAIFHQQGTGRIPQRQMVGVPESLVDQLANTIADDVVDTLKGGL